MIKKSKQNVSLSRSIAALIILPLALALILSAGCNGRNTSTIDRSGGAKKLFERGTKAFQYLQYEDAEAFFMAVMEEHPLSEYALESQLMLGDLNYAKEEYEDAASYYASFVVLHPGHQKSAYALFQKGMSHFNMILSVDRDQTATRKSLFAFEDLKANYPESPYTIRSNELIVFLLDRLAGREFYIGSFYFKDKNYKGALSRFAAILDKYPNCKLVDKTLYFVALSYERLGEERLARDTYDTLLSDYPESPFCKHIKNSD